MGVRALVVFVHIYTCTCVCLNLFVATMAACRNPHINGMPPRFDCCPQMHTRTNMLHMLSALPATCYDRS
jgi:hypothetical protein